MKTKILLITILICMSGIILGQNTIHVPGDYETIQEGIDAAINGDTVLVDQDIYEENISLKGKTIFVTSNYIHTLDSADIYYTIIDGSKPADTNVASVVTFPWGSDTTSVICGFTIKKGKGTLFTNRVGGGILCFDGGKIIHNLIIENSIYADQLALGSAIWAEGWGATCYFVIEHNTIKYNHLENTNSTYGCMGTIGVYDGNIIMKYNIIQSNSSNGRPYGMGTSCNRCEGIISHNTITNNTGIHSLANKSRGGGIYILNHDSGLEISNNEITHNQLIWDTGGGNFRYGGGIAIKNSGGFEYNAILIDGNIIRDNFANLGGGISVTEVYNITISNNVIRDNESEMDGGGIFLQNYMTKGDERPGSTNNSHDLDLMPEKNSLEKPLLVNNTIINNHADFGGGIYSMMNEEKFIAFNNIIYGNAATTMGPEAMIEGNCSGYFYNNNIDTNDIEGAGTWSGTDNIPDDPKFEDEDGHLLWNSPCIGMGLDSIKLEGEMRYCPDHDFDGEQRPLGALVDIGADETPFWVKVNEPHLLPVQISVYPNPASDQITIVLQPGTKVTSFEILDIQGKIVLQQEEINNNFSVDVSNFPKGIYFVRIHTSEGIEVEKLIVQ